MKAKDIMDPVTDYLTPEDTLQQAVQKMRATKRWHGQGLKGMVILDQAGRLIGVLAIKDILRATIPVYMDPRISKFSWDGMLETMASKVACRKVKEFMSTRVVTVPEDAPLMRCVDLLIEKNLQRLPVVDADNKVLGVVYIRDIYNLISKIFTEAPKCEI
ncbi:MAG: CBS domain-containing protein [Proteobacteria bacterium]|nr:CBS domain-containing protein [Pseudomonadota bacterium]MBU1709777.1 CBS domain-containing protein [Pseudomonadota bacterium]